MFWFGTFMTEGEKKSCKNLEICLSHVELFLPKLKDKLLYLVLPELRNMVSGGTLPRGILLIKFHYYNLVTT